MKLALFSIISIGTMALAIWLLFTGLRTLKRTPKYYEQRRAEANRRILIAVVLIALCNLMVNLIPEEWVIGSPPALTEDVRVNREESLEELPVPAEEILLDEAAWLGMEEAQRLAVLQEYANQKAAELGLTEQLTVVLGNLEENVAANYRNSSRTISVDEEFLRWQRPEKLAHTICHEVRHAYQFALTEMWADLELAPAHENLEIFREIEDFRRELDDYISAGEDREAYRQQWVEKDAQAYADRELAALLGTKTAADEE